MAAYINRRKNETDHARLLINFQGQNVPSHAIRNDQNKPVRHQGKHYEYHQDSMWGIVESNAAASMASLPERPGGKKQFLGNRLRHTYRSPFGVAGTTPEKIKSGIRRVHPKRHEDKPRGRRHGYIQDTIHRRRAVAFGNFGTPVQYHPGKGAVKTDRPQSHDHLKRDQSGVETPKTLPHPHNKRLNKHKNERHVDVTKPMEPPSPLHLHKKQAKPDIFDHVRKDHLKSDLIPSTPPPPPTTTTTTNSKTVGSMGSYHHGIKHGDAPQLQDHWSGDTLNTLPKYVIFCFVVVVVVLTFFFLLTGNDSINLEFTTRM